MPPAPLLLVTTQSILRKIIPDAKAMGQRLAGHYMALGVFLMAHSQHLFSLFEAKYWIANCLSPVLSKVWAWYSLLSLDHKAIQNEFCNEMFSGVTI